LKQLTTGLVLLVDHGVRSGFTRELKKVCQRMVADFDRKHLANSRKNSDEMFNKAPILCDFG